MIVLTVIFSKMFQKSIENYPVYYLTGMIIWTMLTGATNAAMTTLVDNKNMLIKVRFPTKIFVMSRVYSLGKPRIFSNPICGNIVIL